MTPLDRWAAIAAALVSVALGLLGFAHGSDERVMDHFAASTRDDLIHLAVGVAGLVSARSAAGARTFLAVGGVAYLGLWLLGAAGGGSWLPLNTADNWLHFLLGLAMLGTGYLTAAAWERSAIG